MSGFGDAVQGGGVAGTTELDANLDGAVLIEDSAGVDFLEIDTANEQVILAAGGAKVGINNADPEGQVHIVEGTESGVAPETGFDTLVLDNAAGPGLTFCSGNNTNGTIAFRTENSGGSDSYAMFIQARQTSSGSNYIGQIRLMNGTSANDFLELETAGSSRLRITGQGKITTGGETTSMADDAGSLHIYTGNSGQTDISGNADDLIVEGVENTGLSIACPNDHQGQIAFTANGTSNDRGAITYLHNGVGGGEAMTFKVNDAVRLNISSAGLAKFAGDVEVEKDSPVLTLDNSAASDNSGERSSTIQFNGVATRGSGTATTLGSIRYQHLGSGTGNRAEWVVSVNDASDSETTDDLNDRLRILGNDGTMRLNGRFQTNDGDAGNPTHSFTNSSNSGMFHAGSNSIAFSANGGEKMRITNDGKVGIGEDTPLGADGGSVHIKTADSGVSDASNDCDELVIEGSGNSGISILSGNSSGTTAFGGLAFGRASGSYRGGVNYRHGSANDYLQFLTAGETKAIVDQNGQMGTVGAGSTTLSAMIMARGNLKTQLTGHLDSSSSGTSLVGDGTDFKTQLQRGSAVKISTSAGNEIFTVESVTSDTVVVLDSAISGTPVDGSNILGDGTLLAAETGDQKQCFAIKPNGGIAVGFARDGDSNEFNNNILLINPDGFTDVGTCAKNVIIGYDPGPSELLKVTDSVIMGYKAGGKGNNYNINNSVVIGNETADSSSGAHESCVVLGKEAGINHATDGIAIGRDSNFTAGSTNEIVIGDAATGNGDNTVTLGNSSIGAIHCQVQTISTLSDSRIKQNVADSAVGLDFINALRPVSYQKLHPADYPAELLEHRFIGGAFDEDGNEIPADAKPGDWSPVSEIGLIAQEVATVAEQFPLVDCHSTAPNGVQSVKYGALIPILVKAVQSLSSEIETLKSQIEASNGN